MNTLKPVLEILAVLTALLVGVGAISAAHALFEVALRHDTLDDDEPADIPTSLEDQKPLEVTITDTDGQWHTFRLGAGDGLAYAGIRIDLLTDTRLNLSHHTHDGAEHFLT